MPKTYIQIAQLKRKEVMSNRMIAKTIGVSRNTVNTIVKKINESGLSYEQICEMTEEDIKRLFLHKVKNTESIYEIPDYEALTKELVKPGVTMQLLWEEYCDTCRLSGQRPYKLTQFKEYFNRHLNKVEFKDVLTTRAGERIEVDWAGMRPHWKDPHTGEAVYGWLFVGVLPFSGLGFAYVTSDMKIPNWINCHIKMFEYFGGVAQTLIPDNLKTAVTKNTKDELIINTTYEDMANYYGTVVIPARVLKPRDKNRAEATVNHLETTIIARLRNAQFFTIEEYNEAVMVEIDTYNNRPFQKKEGSRKSMFDAYEKDTLIPLPMYPYELATYSKAKGQSNSHIVYKKNYYSFPHSFIGKTFELKTTDTKITILYNGNELCTHKLIKNRVGVYVTDSSHMPTNSNAYGEWNSNRYLNWAKTKGPNVYEVVHRAFESVKVEQQKYRSVHSILKLSDKYSDEDLDKACQYALSIKKTPSYKDIKHILESHEYISQEEINEGESTQYAYVRGGDYFDIK